MYISRDEYKLLKQFYKSDGFAIKNDISDILLEKGFLQHKQIKIMRDGSRQCSRLQIFALGQLFSFQFYRCSYLWFLYTVLYFNFTYRTSTATTRDTIETANDTLLVKSGSSILSSIFSFICLRFMSSPPPVVAIVSFRSSYFTE